MNQVTADGQLHLNKLPTDEQDPINVLRTAHMDISLHLKPNTTMVAAVSVEYVISCVPENIKMPWDGSHARVVPPPRALEEARDSATNAYLKIL